MNDIISYNKFNFRKLTRNKFHYTDNRSGLPMHFIGYMIKGTAKIVSNDITVLVNEGELFYIPKNLGYQSYWYGDEKIEFLSLGFLDFGINGNTNFKLQTIPADKKIVDKLMEVPIIGINIDCRAISLFYDAMADIIVNMESSFKSRGEMIVEEIKQCVEKNPHASFSQIADMCSVSQPYLYLLFKRNMNITPNEFRQKVLCKMGMELLITTDKKVEEISGILNFSSGSYFRKVLKKHTGKTPREIRKSGMV